MDYQQAKAAFIDYNEKFFNDEFIKRLVDEITEAVETQQENAIEEILPKAIAKRIAEPEMYKLYMDLLKTQLQLDPQELSELTLLTAKLQKEKTTEIVNQLIERNIQ